MARTDSASVMVNAEVQRVFAALMDPEQLHEWLPPQGMTGRGVSAEDHAAGLASSLAQLAAFVETRE